jgi:hypothetical protein
MINLPQRAGSRWPVTPTASLLCRQARLPTRDMPSSLGRNSEQNDTNRGNPHKAISVRMHYIVAARHPIPTSCLKCQ